MFQTYQKESEIPEALKEHYVEKNGSWVPDGFVSSTKLDEFRTNNRNLAKEKEALQTQLLTFKDVDPTKYAEAVQKLQDLENDRLAEAGEFKILKANLEQAHADAIKKEKENSAKVQAGWNSEKIANATATTVLKHALPAEGNMKYIQADIQNLTSIDPDTGKIVFLDDKGLKMKNEAGDADLELEEYLTKTYIPTSNLFKKSEGSGSIGGYDVPLSGAGQVNIDHVNGKDISGGTIEKLASGEMKAV